MKKDFPIYDINSLSEFRQEDILVSRFAPYLEIHQNLSLPHRHNFYHLLLFTKGSGSHSIDFRQFPVQPFQIYFMIPGQVHSWNFEGLVDGYVINFSIPFFQSFLLKQDYLEQFPFFSGVLENAVIQLPAPQRDEVIRIFEDIIQEAGAAQRLSLDMVRVLMIRLFIIIGRLGLENAARASTAYNYTLLRKFLKLIEKNYATLKLPKEYAELLFITPNHLNALCNQLLGKSAGEVIRDNIILEAKRMLVNLDLSITAISYALNFNDNSYFSRFFKKYTGSSPEGFRHAALGLAKKA